MADSDKSLTLEIKSKADLAGFESAKAELERSIGRSKALGKEYADQEVQLGRVNNALNEYKGAHKEASGEEEEHKHTIAGINLEMGEHRRILGEVERAMPGVLEGARALTGGLGAFGAALAVFEFAKEKLAEYNKELDETAALMAETYGNLAKEIAAANREIAESAAAANSELTKLKENQRGIAEQTDAATAAIKRHEQAQIALTDATAAFQLAQVQAQKKSGAIDDETAARREAQIKHEAELRRNQLANTADQGAAGQKNKELDNATVEQHRVQALVDAGAPGESMRQAKIKDAPAEIESFTKLLSKANEEVKKNQGAYDQSVEAARQNASDNRNGTGLNVPSDEQSQAAVDAAKLDLDVSKAKQAGYEKEITNISDRASKYKTDQKLFEDAKSTLAEVSEKVKSLSQELATMLTEAKENATQRAKLTNIHEQTQFVEHPFGAVDPKTSLPPVAPVPRRPTPAPQAPQPHPEMSPDEIEARGGIAADKTRANRAQQAAEREARETAQHAAKIAEDAAEIGKAMNGSVAEIVRAMNKLKHDMGEIRGQLKGSLNK